LQEENLFENKSRDNEKYEKLKKV